MYSVHFSRLTNSFVTTHIFCTKFVRASLVCTNTCRTAASRLCISGVDTFDKALLNRDGRDGCGENYGKEASRGVLWIGTQFIVMDQGWCEKMM